VSLPSSPIQLSASRLQTPFVEGESLTALSLSDAHWSEIEQQVNLQGSHDSLGSEESLQLPPITALERDAYFGKKARAEFLDIYRQLSRQQNVFKDSRFVTDSTPLPNIHSKRPKKIGRAKSGRFMRSGGNFSLSPLSVSLSLVSLSLSLSLSLSVSVFCSLT
jgi:hypothetical protein